MARVITDYVHPTKSSIEDAAAEKMGILTDLGLLYKVPTSKTNLLNDILLKCRSENEMTTMLHDFIRGKETLDELLIRKAEL